ncbi:MAG TPA: hypothetical protein VH186_30970 [Chloroflexia bacterium]|nr:hypothetical protein [Chloroflexia bacterium]
MDNDNAWDDGDDWFEARNAFKAGLKIARQWQPDARSALIEVEEYPPAHVNEEGEWEAQYWSPGARKGLVVYLDKELQPIRQEEWGTFYQEMAVKAGNEILGPQGFSYAPEISPPGPDGLSFIFRRQSPTYRNQHDFVDVQISTSVMLTPPPRRFTINLIRNNGDRPLYGQFGGYEARLGTLLPEPKMDYWWSFKTEEEYEAKLYETFRLVVQYGLSAMM